LTLVVGVQVTTLARLLFEASVLESGFQLEDPKSFTSRVQGLIRGSLDVPADAQAEVANEQEEEENSAQESAGQAKDEL
jgi:heat shock protein beta